MLRRGTGREWMLVLTPSHAALGKTPTPLTSKDKEPTTYLVRAAVKVVEDGRVGQRRVS